MTACKQQPNDFLNSSFAVAAADNDATAALKEQLVIDISFESPAVESLIAVPAEVLLEMSPSSLKTYS